MTANELMELMNRAPFEPFEIRLKDGIRISVDHPWQIATAPDSTTFTIYEAEYGMRIVAFRNISEVVTTVSA